MTTTGRSFEAIEADNERRVSTNFKDVADFARKNGWKARAISFAGPMEGIVLFYRDYTPLPGKQFGTAAFRVERDSVEFRWGHYDFDWDEAQDDFATRTKKGY